VGYQSKHLQLMDFPGEYFAVGALLLGGIDLPKPIIHLINKARKAYSKSKNPQPDVPAVSVTMMAQFCVFSGFRYLLVKVSLSNLSGRAIMRH